jgi:UDP-N-acetylenolpyruvoylglucosamine reductase
VWALIERARSEVASRFGHELELEVHVLGNTP